MPKAVVFSLGCKVNDVEGASIVRGLEERGYEVSAKLEYADLYVLNTCAVTAEAEKKSRQLLARARKYNPDAKIIVCGCAVQKNAEAFSSREGVTLVTGARQKSRILDLLDETGVRIDDFDRTYDDMPVPAAVKSRHFIKIQDGCNNFCTYCIVPYLRGRSRSRSAESILREASDAGADETVLTGIDISDYRDGERRLADLLLLLSGVPTRMRLSSLEVNVIDGRLLSVARDMYDFAPHFHLSLQSGSDAVLKRMNRHYTREQYLEKCAMIYRCFPDAAITTDIIVGFPGETEEDFEDSLRMVGEAGFAQIHCFVYSPREGTPAARMAQLPPAVKDERKGRLLAAAQRCRAAYVGRYIGRVLEFVPEEKKDGYTYGYTQNYIRTAVPGNITGRQSIKLTEQTDEFCIGELI